MLQHHSFILLWLKQEQIISDIFKTKWDLNKSFIFFFLSNNSLKKVSRETFHIQWNFKEVLFWLNQFHLLWELEYPGLTFILQTDLFPGKTTWMVITRD